MNISWMTLRDLEYLVTLARTVHFGQAAEACHVSQPALSSQVRKIEGMLGFSIFERTNRRVALTERGKQVVEQAQIVLEEAQKIASVAEENNAYSRPHGTISIGSIATLGPYYVPHFLGPLMKEFPRLQPVLREGLTDSLLGELRAGELDVVLAARTFEGAGLRIFELFKEPFVLAVPKNHPLAKNPHPRASDLQASEMVLLEDGHCLRDQALQICPPNRRGKIRQYHATSLETLRHLVAAGMGYTLIPSLAVQSETKMQELLKYRKLQEPIGRTIVAACRERFPRMKEIEQIVAFLKQNPPV